MLGARDRAGREADGFPSLGLVAGEDVAPGGAARGGIGGGGGPTDLAGPFIGISSVQGLGGASGGGEGAAFILVSSARGLLEGGGTAPGLATYGGILDFPACPEPEAGESGARGDTGGRSPYGGGTGALGGGV